jgi:hypothetical protein
LTLRRFRSVVDAILERQAADRRYQRTLLEWQTRELAVTIAVGSGNKKLVERAQTLSIFPSSASANSGDQYGRPPGPDGLPFDPEAEIDYERLNLPNAARAGMLLTGLQGR